MKVKIYNLAAELVYEKEWRDTNGSHKWECVNSQGKKLASGIYIYLLTDLDSNSTKRGKLGIVR
ncbi:MAG: gliding motility-associated C-terminal domain-containing protein [bacterium]|nr:gliding motility-associated C-terminal domain-containing protein [bacterium]